MNTREYLLNKVFEDSTVDEFIDELYKADIARTLRTSHDWGVLRAEPSKTFTCNMTGHINEDAINRLIPKYLYEKVIFNDPATIVYWIDGDKTVVKTMDGDAYDPEVGFAMAFCKKMLGSEYKKTFKDIREMYETSKKLKEK